MDNLELRAQLEELHLPSFGWALACCAQDPAEAEEVLQDVYLKVLQGRAVFRGQASFRTWLFAVIRRTAAEQRRRNWFRRLWLTRYETRSETGETAQTPDELLEQSQRQMIFQRGFARLPKRQREVLHLVFYQDLSLSEAAIAMGVSVDSARTHYERGKKSLRDWIEHHGIFDEPRLTRPETQDAVH